MVYQFAFVNAMLGADLFVVYIFTRRDECVKQKVKVEHPGPKDRVFQGEINRSFVSVCRLILQNDEVTR